GRAQWSSSSRWTRAASGSTPRSAEAPAPHPAAALPRAGRPLYFWVPQPTIGPRSVEGPVEGGAVLLHHWVLLTEHGEDRHGRLPRAVVIVVAVAHDHVDEAFESGVEVAVAEGAGGGEVGLLHRALLQRVRLVR